MLLGVFCLLTYWRELCSNILEVTALVLPLLLSCGVFGVWLACYLAVASCLACVIVFCVCTLSAPDLSCSYQLLGSCDRLLQQHSSNKSRAQLFKGPDMGPWASVGSTPCTTSTFVCIVHETCMVGLVGALSGA